MPTTKAFTSYTAWEKRGRELNAASNRLSWETGDWWNSGSHSYGERARLAAEQIFGREIGTLQNCSVALRRNLTASGGSDPFRITSRLLADLAGLSLGLGVHPA